MGKGSRNRARKGVESAERDGRQRDKGARRQVWREQRLRGEAGEKRAKKVHERKVWRQQIGQ